jgi:hypothetical protein
VCLVDQQVSYSYVIDNNNSASKVTTGDDRIRQHRNPESSSDERTASVDIGEAYL